MLIRRFPALALALFCSVLVFADSKPAPQPRQQPMSKETRMLVIRSLNAEFVFARQPIPMGQKPLVLKDGKITPSGPDFERLLATSGTAAKPGDRVQITSIEIKDNKIVFELNGGPKKKTKWYQRVQVGGMGGTAQLPDDAAKEAHGAIIELAFDKFVPEMTGDQVRELLAPLLNFNAKSAAEAYLDTVPPKVKEAVKNHEVLVGMNRELVTITKGRPERKIREKDDQGHDYEEWLYGQPPAEVQFVRFIGDEVTQLKIMKVDGEMIVRKEKEVDLTPMLAAQQQQIEQQKKEQAEAQKAAAKKPPSLRRPGDIDEPPPDAGSPSQAPQTRPPVPPPTSIPPGQAPGGPGTMPPSPGVPGTIPPP